MMNLLNKKIELYLGRKPDFIDEVQVVDDGKGNLTIDVWNATDKEKPTEEQLNAFTDEATKSQNNDLAVDNRQKEYGSIAKQIEYITENGLEAWPSKVQEIKTKYPKENS
jgi:phosphatidate phosphatase PAH1